MREKTGPKTLVDFSEKPQSKRFLKLAHQTLSTGNTRSALQNLKFALSMDSDNEDIAAKIAELEAS